MAGRQELVKIQTIRPMNDAQTEAEGKTVPIRRARRAATRLRSMKGTG